MARLSRPQVHLLDALVTHPFTRVSRVRDSECLTGAHRFEPVGPNRPIFREVTVHALLDRGLLAPNAHRAVLTAAGLRAWAIDRRARQRDDYGLTDPRPVALRVAGTIESADAGVIPLWESLAPIPCQTCGVGRPIGWPFVRVPPRHVAGPPRPTCLPCARVSLATATLIPFGILPDRPGCGCSNDCRTALLRRTRDGAYEGRMRPVAPLE